MRCEGGRGDEWSAVAILVVSDEVPGEEGRGEEMMMNSLP